MNGTTPALLTVPQAAEALGMSTAHTYGYVLSGELRSVQLGKSRRVPVAAIEEFIDYVAEQGGSLPSRRGLYAGRRGARKGPARATPVAATVESRRDAPGCLN